MWCSAPPRPFHAVKWLLHLLTRARLRPPLRSDLRVRTATMTMIGIEKWSEQQCVSGLSGVSFPACNNQQNQGCRRKWKIGCLRKVLLSAYTYKIGCAFLHSNDSAGSASKSVPVVSWLTATFHRYSSFVHCSILGTFSFTPAVETKKKREQEEWLQSAQRTC